MPVEFSLSGVRELQYALTEKVAAMDAAAREVVTKGGHMIERAAKGHANGRPGPNVVTGSHRRSIGVHSITKKGTSWESQTGPTMVYSRRLELGYVQVDALGRLYDQPPYPSLGPGLQDVRDDLGALARSVYRKALGV